MIKQDEIRNISSNKEDTDCEGEKAGKIKEKNI